MKKLFKNDFCQFLSLHFLLWVIVPTFRRSLPLDSLEAITWGRYCDWGTNKHPTLSGFLAELFYQLFNGHNIGIYILSQVCVLIGFIYIFKLAKCFLDEKKSWLAVMLLEGVVYYGFSAQEYNVNVVSLALWPLTTYYFYRAIQENKISAWFLTGLFAGLNIFNKYVGGILLLAMALYLFFTKEGRAQFKKVGPYLTFAVFLLVLAPHVWWLYQYDFYPFEYLAERTEGKTETWWWKIGEHIVFPLRFVLAQISFSLLAIFIYFQAYRRGEKTKMNLSEQNKKFLLYMGGAPVLIFAAISLLSGIRLKSMWGFPTLYLLGILLFAFFPFKLTEVIYAKMKKSVYMLMILGATVALAIIFFNPSEKINFQSKAFAKDMSDVWKQHSGSDLDYVGGEIWYAANVSIYAPENPKPVAEMHPKYSPWFDEKDILCKGALVIFPHKKDYEKCRSNFKNISEPYEYKLEFSNRIGKLKHKTIYYGFFEPSAEECHD